MTTPTTPEGRRELKALAEKAGADIVGFEINPVHQSEKPPGLATELFNVWVECRNRDGFTDESRFASGMLREDAEYVVAANPATVLSLLAALEEAEGREAALREALTSAALNLDACAVAIRKGGKSEGRHTLVEGWAERARAALTTKSGEA